jgi:cytochrome P450 family 4
MLNLGLIKSILFNKGQSTVATAISWGLYALAAYPEIQDNLVEELDRVFSDTGREPTLQDLAELKYLDRFIKETLRVYPTVPLIERLIFEDIILDCNSLI